MDIVRSWTYVFDDPDWVNKVVITAIITALSIALTPLFIGLLGWAALFGYLVELVRNVRLGVPNPMPRWDDFNRFLASGANVLAAFIVYSLPTLVMGCISGIILPSLSNGVIGGGLTLIVSCCMFPILLVYNVIVLPLLAVGIGRYADDPRINAFFEFSFLLETMRQHMSQVIQWWLGTIVAGIVFAIPLIGWVLMLALLIPVYGMLTGQLAVALLGDLKSKPKRR
ncbi:MAG TPA: DUF4013 domain-containing protein [Phototrophicaceae bacterium]|nr:DUF4013 domain-containing protein [Phototrophicaceae bacterium]